MAYFSMQIQCYTPPHHHHQLVAQTSPAWFSVLTKEIGIPGESSALPVGIRKPCWTGGLPGLG